MYRHRGKGRFDGRLRQLKQEAQSVINNITQRQLANILNDHTEKWELYLEVPYGETPWQEHARIWVRANREPEKNTLDPGNLSLSFTVETSRLGTVNVQMSFSGKMVSLRFALKDESVRTLAEEMGQEIGESLKTRGYAVRAVTFGIQGDEIGHEKKANAEMRTGNMDIIG